MGFYSLKMRSLLLAIQTWPVVSWPYAAYYASPPGGAGRVRRLAADQLPASLAARHRCRGECHGNQLYCTALHNGLYPAIRALFYFLF